MTEDERFALGQEMFTKVIGDVLPMMTREMGAVATMTVTNIFADIWGRDIMSIRDRRLAVIGALAAMSTMTPLETHLRAALTLGEITIEEAHEIAVALSAYIGAPRTTGVVQLVYQLEREGLGK